MLLDFGLLLLGGVVLYFGAEWLVRGAAGMAIRFGIPPIVIGLTVVSYGTSAPELAVSLIAVTRGNSDIALGNVVGSNIANIGLILGLTALIAPPTVEAVLAKRELPFLILATLAVPIVLYDGVISFGEGGLFVLGAIGFTLATFFWGRDVAPSEEVEELTHERLGSWALSGLFFIGLVLLVAGGRFFVSGAVGVAEGLGVSQRTIGLTVVAFGTSVPELAASLVAALRGHSELAVGNVVGSNLFNILLILGVTAIVHPLVADLDSMLVDIVVMGGLTVALAISLRGARRMTRAEGALYTLAYAGFIGWLVVAA